MRSWNLFHGNAVPPERTAYLDEMIRLATADRPAVVCLQEVPAWALDQLGEWSGMQTFGDIAARPAIGPLPSTAAIGRALTALHHGIFRSFVAGQANAVLLSRAVRVDERHVCVLNPRSFRRAQARRLRLDLVSRLAWARERRICQALRVVLPDGRRAVVANLHATNLRHDPRLPDAELVRAATFADGLARADDGVLLCGDFNVTQGRSRTLRDLVTSEWGFSGAISGIDHILVRGFRIVEGPTRWHQDRRRLNGRVLSDHRPIEVRIA